MTIDDLLSSDVEPAGSLRYSSQRQLRLGLVLSVRRLVTDISGEPA